MTGSVTRSANGYRYVIELGSEKGKRKQITKSGFDTRKAANKALRERLQQLEKDIAFGVSPDTETLTVGAYLTDWIEKTKTELKYKTYVEYKNIVQKKLIPAFGYLQLKKLNAMHITSFYQENQELAANSLRYYHAVLNKALNQALQWRLITLNPMTAVKKPKLIKEEMRVYDSEQLKQFLQLLEGRAIYYPVLIAASTGLRIGEIAALRWSDIENGTIYVTQQLQEGEDGLELVPLKTKGSKRKVPLMDITKKALRELDIRYKEYKLRGGEYFQDLGFILCNEDGNPYAPAYLSRNYRRTLKEYTDNEGKNLLQRFNLPYIRFHDLRHTHATLLLKQGVNPKIVAERLGHATVVMTLDTYSHVLPDMQEEAVEKLNQLFQ